MIQNILNETFYTPEQLADKLQFSLTTIYNLIKSREIPAIRIGKCFRIPASALAKIFKTRSIVVPKVATEFITSLKVKRWSSKIVDVIFFGSYARGEEKSDSDIDILMIHSGLTGGEVQEVLETEDEVSASAGYLDNMNVIKKSVLQWKIMEDHEAALFKTVKEEGISIWK